MGKLGYVLLVMFVCFVVDAVQEHNVVLADPCPYLECTADREAGYTQVNADDERCCVWDDGFGSSYTGLGNCIDTGAGFNETDCPTHGFRNVQAMGCNGSGTGIEEQSYRCIKATITQQVIGCECNWDLELCDCEVLATTTLANQDQCEKC